MSYNVASVCGDPLPDDCVHAPDLRLVWQNVEGTGQRLVSIGLVVDQLGANIEPMLYKHTHKTLSQLEESMGAIFVAEQV